MSKHHTGVLMLVMTTLLLVPFFGNAQIIVLPDCNDQPQHPFCQGQCVFDPTLPWCVQPEPDRTPVLILPGITVSQNKKLLYKDEPSEKWKFAFGYNVYKSLIKKLEEAEYEEGEDLMVVHYDWRKSAEHNAVTYLQQKINEIKAKTGASKVDIVAHSFGGVVSRAYIQGEGYNNDVDQLVTLGTPHEGAADAYVAWEGGVFPQGWNPLMRLRITKIERGLQKVHHAKHVQRPITFRSFFPSLHDMLSINDYLNKDDSVISINDLTERNNFLLNLRSSFADLAARGVALSAIAGNNLDTLKQVNVSGPRTHEDEKLKRWRDGRPDTIPPPLDSKDGDARVILSSALVGSDKTIINGAKHHKLPEEAQDKVLEILGLDKVEEQFTEKEPVKIFGITILSPVDLEVTGPDGQKLTNTLNEFGDEVAEFDDDLSDPDDPKDITIVDPPDGKYLLKYTGTGEGDYAIIVTYADEDETISWTKDGQANTQFQFEQEIFIGNGTISLLDDSDYKALLKQISFEAQQAKKQKIIKGYEKSNITRQVNHALSDLKIYEGRMKKSRESAALSRLHSYYDHLDEIERAVENIGKTEPGKNTAQEIQELLTKIRIYSPPL